MSRMVKLLLIAALAAGWARLPARGETTYYVATNGVDSRAGTNWDTALLTISNALAQTAASGDTILVSNGTYGLTATNLIITNGVVLRGFSGNPSDTIITRTGAGKFRILYISNVTAFVDGFTISNGNPSAGNNTKGGGILIDSFGTVSNCIITGCLLPLNSQGAGVYLNRGGTVKNSRIIYNSNWQDAGGGVYLYQGGVVENCEIANNFQSGGAYLDAGGLLRNCLIYNNTYTYTGAARAGGVHCAGGGTVESCTIVSNSNSGGIGLVQAGGLACAAGGTILNSIIYFNKATAGSEPNYSNSGSGWSYTNCCTTPAVSGVSNIPAAPEFTDAVSGNFRLLPGSPCIDTGANQDWMTNALDLDGHARILNTNVDMGAYEYQIGTLACSPNGTPVTGLASNKVVFTAGVAGTNTAGLYYQWDFTNHGSAFNAEGADKQIVTNVYGPGLYSVRLVVTNAIGESATCVRSNYIQVGPATAYVATNGSAIYPYTNWAGAATTIQAAVDAGVDGTKVLVSNGVYGITSQINLEKGITIQSVSGCSNTAVKRASGSCRIFYLSHSNAVVDGFTITNGSPAGGNSTLGGGVLIDSFGTVSNCLITGNVLPLNSQGIGVCLNLGGYVRNCQLIHNDDYQATGGGVYLIKGGVIENCEIANNYGCGGAYLASGGLLKNCLIYNNTYNYPGVMAAGGVHCGGGGTVESCSIVSNYGSGKLPVVGGLFCTNGGTILNSIIYLNMSSNGVSPNYSNSPAGWSYTNCCTTPAVAGDGNITADPLFVSTNAANYRLTRASPCVNAGTNQPWMLPVDGGAIDLDGYRRIFYGRVDIGAYEVFPPKGTVLATW